MGLALAKLRVTSLDPSFFCVDVGAPPGQLFHGKGGDRQEDRDSHQLEEAHQAGNTRTRVLSAAHKCTRIWLIRY